MQKSVSVQPPEDGFLSLDDSGYESISYQKICPHRLGLRDFLLQNQSIWKNSWILHPVRSVLWG